jgi:hypothetical protein
MCSVCASEYEGEIIYPIITDRKWKLVFMQINYKNRGLQMPCGMIKKGSDQMAMI